MADLKLDRIERWAPHPSAAPLTEQDGNTFAAAANGTRTCVGGWQAIFSGVEPGVADWRGVLESDPDRPYV